MKSGRLLTILLLVVSLVLTSCWDRTEVNDIAIVIAFAMDKGKNGEYLLSVQVPLVSQMGGSNSGGGGGGTSGDKMYYVDSAEGKTLWEASSIIQSRMSRNLYYAHHRVIVIGEDLAKDGLEQTMDVIARFPENRLTAYLVMAKGKGIDLLQAQPQFERFSGEAMRELIKMQSIPVRVKDIAQILNTPGSDPFLPYVAAVDTHPKGRAKEIQVLGIAQFRKDKLVGIFPPDVSQGIRWFQRNFAGYSTHFFTAKNQKVSIEIDKGKAVINPVLKSDHVHFEILIQANATVVENMTMADLSHKSNLNALEEKLRENIKQSVEQVLTRIQKQQADTIGLGLVVARKYPRDWKRTYRANWYEQLKKATFHVQVSAQITNIGQITENITKEERK
jgi:Ger(x)C family germination protein